MDILLCQLRRPRPSSIFRQYALLWHGICWNPWDVVGLDYRHDIYPVRRAGNGYVP
jgi:hypothetical protein